MINERCIKGTVSQFGALIFRNNYNTNTNIIILGAYCSPQCRRTPELGFFFSVIYIYILIEGYQCILR